MKGKSIILAEWNTRKSVIEVTASKIWFLQAVFALIIINIICIRFVFLIWFIWIICCFPIWNDFFIWSRLWIAHTSRIRLLLLNFVQSVFHWGINIKMNEQMNEWWKKSLSWMKESFNSFLILFPSCAMLVHSKRHPTTFFLRMPN